jgi:hypothetical protein
MSYFTRSFLLSLSVTDRSTGFGWVTVTDSGGYVVWQDSLASNLAVVNHSMGAAMPIRVSVSLGNFTGHLSLAIVFGEPNADIMPLAVGNQWIYLSTSYAVTVPETTIYEITQQIPIQVKGNTLQAWALRTYFKDVGPNGVLWLRLNGVDGLHDLGGVSPTRSMLTDNLELKYPAHRGDTWQVQNITYSPYDSLFHIKDTLTYSLDTTGVLVQTRAGLFSCFVYKYSEKPDPDILEPWDYYWYYSPGIGMVGGKVLCQFYGDNKGEFWLLGYHVQ